MALFGDISRNTDVTEMDVQATVIGSATPVTLTLVAGETYKRYTAISTNMTINASGVLYPGTLFLHLQNDNIAPRTITWGSLILAASPTLVLTQNKEIVCTFKCNGSNWLLIHISAAL